MIRLAGWGRNSFATPLPGWKTGAGITFACQISVGGWSHPLNYNTNRMMSARRSLVPALSATMIIGYGSMFYAFAVLSRPIQMEMGWSPELTVGAYSLALLISGVAAYPVGHIVDHYGGRNILAAGSAIAGLLFMALATVHSIFLYYLIWIGIGFAMAMCLYEPAFAVVVAHHPDNYRNRIAILTLAGGLSSTVFWPITHELVTHIGWRDAVLLLGAINVAVCLPLHWFTVPAGAAEHSATAATPELPAHLTPTLRRMMRTPTFWLLITAFTASGILMSAMAVHVIPLLESRGFDPTAAVVIASLVGPMQVASRFTEMIFSKHVPTLLLGAVTVVLMPLGLTVLLIPEWLSVVYLFVFIYGAGLGLITMVRATAPLAFFGRSRYGSVSGLLAVPTVAARAIGPYVAAAMLTAFGSYTLVLTLLICVGMVGAICYWIAIATRQESGTVRDTGDALHAGAVRVEMT